ncbi:DUF3800 domain-containing protein [Candidatus Saccharibacteria bacterium]|nr:MAG: DUF3800 domain-containing protein [Candidatus Saccharibacteria bacterium]
MSQSTTGPKGQMCVWGYLDETGSLGSPTSGIFGMGLLVTPSPRILHKRVSDLRSQLNYKGEFKFSNVRINSLPLYKKLLDVYFESVNARFTARIYLRDNFRADLHVTGEVYKVYNRISARLISSALDKGKYTQSDYIAVIADDISTQVDDNFESEIRAYLRGKHRRNALFGMSRAESHAFAELQVADVLLGTVAYAFKLKHGLLDTQPNPGKLEIVKHLQAHLGVDSLADNVMVKRKYGHRFEISDKTTELNK